LLQDQTSQQDTDRVTRLTSVEPARHFLPEPLERDDDGWADKNMTALEKELLSALQSDKWCYRR
jgi:hypothetical protein